MATLREAPIQPLDIILFHGIDPVSHAICFVEAKRFGHGDFSHAGVAITREVLDLPFLEPGKVYVWESTLSAPAGFWAHFTDKVPDAETQGLRFGVQIRDLELVIPGYSVGGGKVAWCAFRGERPPIEETRKRPSHYTRSTDTPHARRTSSTCSRLPSQRCVRLATGSIAPKIVWRTL
jgi:hypothetical protein